MATHVHDLALVEPGAQLDDDVFVGPFCHVGPEVKLGKGTRLISHVSLAGDTQLGPDCLVYPFASIGHAPQDLKYQGEPSRVEVGARVTFREHCVVHRGTAGGGMLTRLGDDVLVMGAAHVAHDCRIGNKVILVHASVLGGHVEIDDYAIVGGCSAVHQFVRIGRHAMIGGSSMVVSDVLPYTTVNGPRAHLTGVNLVGMKRRGFSRTDMQALRDAIKKLFDKDGQFRSVLADLQQGADDDTLAVAELLDFLGAGDSKRHYTGPATP